MSEYVRSASGCGGIGALPATIGAARRRSARVPCGPTEDTYPYYEDDARALPMFARGCRKAVTGPGAAAFCCPSLPGPLGMGSNISVASRAAGVSSPTRDSRLGWTPCGPLETQYAFHNDMRDIPLFNMGCHKRTSIRGTVMCCPTLPGPAAKGLRGLGDETTGHPWLKVAAIGLVGLALLMMVK
jgi:hypothetical protein